MVKRVGGMHYVAVREDRAEYIEPTHNTSNSQVNPPDTED
jgi:hypothetical protein